jgi:hypothetical protein
LIPCELWESKREKDTNERKSARKREKGETEVRVCPGAEAGRIPRAKPELIPSQKEGKREGEKAQKKGDELQSSRDVCSNESRH